MRLTMFLCTLLVPFIAKSECYVRGTVLWKPNNFTLSIPTIVLNNATSDGTVVYSKELYSTGRYSEAYASGVSPDCEILSYKYDNSVVEGLYNTVNTNIKGLGLRVSGKNPHRGWTLMNQSTRGRRLSDRSLVYWASYPGDYTGWKIELVKTGNYGGSSTNIGSYKARAMVNNRSDKTFFSLDINSASMVVPSATCDLVTNHLDVNLGTIGNIGLAANAGANKVPFSIALNCENGAKVTMKIESPLVSNNAILNSVGDKYAKGVGVVVSHLGNIVKPNNSALINSSTISGPVSIDMTAQMVPTGSTAITPGEFYAQATFTLTYD